MLLGVISVFIVLALNLYHIVLSVMLLAFLSFSLKIAGVQSVTYEEQISS